MSNNTYTDTLIVSDELTGKRLDAVLTDQFSEYSRSFMQRVIDEGNVSIDGKICRKPGCKLKNGNTIMVTIPEPEPLIIEAENIPLDIMYEDEDVIVINKPKGMVVHPAAGHIKGTLVNALMFHCKDSLSGINGVLRPGIVHRIDMDTTGVIIACKNDFSHNSIALQLKEHTITRRYYAIVYGSIKEDSGTVNAPIGRDPLNRKRMAINREHGKEAVTHYKVIERFGNYTWIECQLETGRTHQIRVHMTSLGHPLLGDSLYGPSKCPFNLQGQTLHAYVLGFTHPRTSKYLEFQADLPDYFKNLIRILRAKSITPP